MFSAQCQEKSTRAAFNSKRDDDEYIMLKKIFYKMVLDENATAQCFGSGSRWFPPSDTSTWFPASDDTDPASDAASVTATEDAYYMVGGDITPVVGDSAVGGSVSGTRGWVMQAFVGRARTKCEPYRGAPSVCSANRVCR